MTWRPTLNVLSGRLFVPTSPSKRLAQKLIVLGLCMVSVLLVPLVLSRESARSELENLQEQAGVTIGVFNYKGIGVLIFQKRSFTYRKLLFDGNSMMGMVSRDGTEIALTQPLTKPSSVLVVHPDGTDLREYKATLFSEPICWSYDNSRLALTTPGPKIGLLELKSKLVQNLNVATGVLASSQCWSPDGNRIVYESPDKGVIVHDLVTDKSTKLTNGVAPAWSPDGNWIAYRDGDTYYAIHPSGEGRKKLFHKTRAVSGLIWSPDSRFVAYVHQDFFALDVEFYHLMVRRLEDGSEAWVADGEDGGGNNYQWVTSMQLPDLVKSQSSSR